MSSPKLYFVPFFLGYVLSKVSALSLSMNTKLRTEMFHVENRRSFVTNSVFATVASTLVLPSVTNASPEILNTPSGIKYAITRSPKEKGAIPQPGDIVGIEYTGYLTNGQIFDATHSEGKQNALLFKLGSGSVIPGLDEIVAYMKVGEKVQAIIPPSLAYGDKGVCIEDGECLIKPGSTLVYDISLKKSSIPPP